MNPAEYTAKVTKIMKSCCLTSSKSTIGKAVKTVLLDPYGNNLVYVFADNTYIAYDTTCEDGSANIEEMNWQNLGGTTTHVILKIIDPELWEEGQRMKEEEEAKQDARSAKRREDEEAALYMRLKEKYER